MAGTGLGEAHGCFDRFRPARIQLRAVEIPRGDLGQELHQRRPVLRGEAAHVHPRDLALEPRHVLRVGIPEARHGDAGEQIDVAVPVDVVEDRALAAVDAQLAEERDALRAGGEVARLRVPVVHKPHPPR